MNLRLQTAGTLVRVLDGVGVSAGAGCVREGPDATSPTHLE